ncbi:MAG TPA: DUF4301 family protein [Thermoanaerobaculaceae bacterium]|mgnify:CR=1 FL=1|nr:DUF4301 family protein [Thermoanaerobaculaceae bacterium]HRS17399.1 DUF4301 family protein [Thermoanaerobaculaceae bacterium]
MIPPSLLGTGLTDADWRLIELRGMDAADVAAQLELLASPPGFARLVRPCTVGDGIEQITPGSEHALLRFAEEAAAAGRITRFVPASGAATRMFDALLQALLSPRDPVPPAARALLGELHRFAFVAELAAAARAEGRDLEQLRAAGDWPEVVRLLLDEPGIGYGALPKGLLLFHSYPGGPRTAFEEHLREAAAHVASRDGVCALHFTASAEHRARFAGLLERLRPSIETELGCRFEVAFSVQHPGTDTLAADLEGRPFRTDDGSLLFRPGGHGALLRNLAELGADLVVIKNIDNILPEHRRPPAVHWKKLLTGVLVDLQQQVRQALADLRSPSPAGDACERAAALARRLGHAVPPVRTSPAALASLLDRPIRVCGMVRNEGEPGGGPFWVAGEGDEVRPQIVEGSQVDPGDPEQQAILRRATHFNPVDLVCAVRDAAGRPYDLARFVDPRAVLVTTKSHQGRPLRALERPGLWNGAMARWSTLFVEVPPFTFAPVKTVFDLLRPEHQPQGD